jgi:hypothetical protein
MAIGLDSFRRIANTNQSNVRLSDSKPDTVKTRGAFGAWIASKRAPDKLRTENAAVASAFLQALKAEAGSLPESLGSANNPLKDEYRTRLNEAIDTISSKLEGQRLGTAKLSTADVRSAIRFIDAIKSEAISDIALEEAQNLGDEAHIVISQLKLDSGTPEHASPGSLFAKLLNGQSLSKDEYKFLTNFTIKADTLAEKALATLEKLESTKVKNETPENAAARAKVTAQLKALAPTLNIVKTLEWLATIDSNGQSANAKVAATTVKIQGDQTLSSTRNAAQLVDAFHAGEKLGEQDLKFLKAWLSPISGIAVSITALSRNTELKGGLLKPLTAIYKTHEQGLHQLGLRAPDSQESAEALSLQTSADNPVGDERPVERPIAEHLEDQVWNAREAIASIQQQFSVLKEKVNIAINSQGNFAQADLQAANPWRTRPEGSDIRPGDRGDLGPLQAEPQKSARKGVPTLEERNKAWVKREAALAKQTIYKNQETNWVHEPQLQGEDYSIERNGLDDAGKIARRAQREAANLRDGFVPNGKGLAAGGQANVRLRNKEIKIDPQAVSPRSVSDAHQGSNNLLEGVAEASNPVNPRRPRRDTGV